jgi:hypothetical protein
VEGRSPGTASPTTTCSFARYPHPSSTALWSNRRRASAAPALSATSFLIASERSIATMPQLVQGKSRSTGTKRRLNRRGDPLQVSRPARWRHRWRRARPPTTHKMAMITADCVRYCGAIHDNRSRHRKGVPGTRCRFGHEGHRKYGYCPPGTGAAGPGRQGPGWLSWLSVSRARPDHTVGCSHYAAALRKYWEIPAWRRAIASTSPLSASLSRA